MDTPTMASLPSGVITLRDARRSQSREVALEAFELAVSPVHARASGLPRVPFTWFDGVGYCNGLSRAAGLQEAYTVQRRNVAWDISADGYRLPTEAEWEYACRAGTTSPTYGPLEDTAWTNLDHLEGPQPVGRKEPCLLYTSDAADEGLGVDLGGRRIIKKKK